MSARVDAVASRVQGALTTRKVNLQFMNKYFVSKIELIEQVFSYTFLILKLDVYKSLH